MDDLIRTYLSELDTALAVVPGSGLVRAAVVTEIGDGLADAVADRIDLGDPPHLAARRAVEEFGSATSLAAGFLPILATAHVHRRALTLLRTGPPVGALWLVAVFAGHAYRSPIVTVAGITVAAVLLPCGVFAALAARRGSRWWNLSPFRTAEAARIATSMAILVDLVMLVALVLSARAEGTPAVVAALASATRIGLATRSMTGLRRSRDLLI
ncbi:MAG TPA: hypothetical protein VFX16_09645 [Pseudonocardiaceae bacterium]|nr:hypothetical protein [Pseudonocardiaceae bacterium]